MNPLTYAHNASIRIAPVRGLSNSIGFILCLLMFPVLSAENYDLAILGHECGLPVGGGQQGATFE